MSPYAYLEKAPENRVPRASGDEPPTWAEYMHWTRCSPRERG